MTIMKETPTPATTRAQSTCLKNNPDKTPETGHPDPFDTSVGIGETAGPKGPEESAEVVHGSDATLQRGLDDLTMLIGEAHAILQL
jgi:hypothetical protein